VKQTLIAGVVVLMLFPTLSYGQGCGGRQVPAAVPAQGCSGGQAAAPARVYNPDPSYYTNILKAELQKLNLKTPEKDLEKNFAKGEKKFMGINGYALTTPGVDSADQKLVEQNGVQPIKGTTDMLEGQEHLQLISDATDYAERYNQALLKKLK